MWGGEGHSGLRQAVRNGADDKWHLRKSLKEEGRNHASEGLEKGP